MCCSAPSSSAASRRISPARWRPLTRRRGIARPQLVTSRKWSAAWRRERSVRSRWRWRTRGRGISLGRLRTSTERSRYATRSSPKTSSIPSSIGCEPIRASPQSRPTCGQAVGHTTRYPSFCLTLSWIRPMLRRSFVILLLFVSLRSARAVAQRTTTDSSLLTVDRIFGSPEFRGGTLGALAWLSDGTGYSTLEPALGGKPGQDIVRYDAETGLKTILVPAARLVPPGDSTPLDIEEYTWSADGRRLLIFTNSQQVWRANTRG